MREAGVLLHPTSLPGDGPCGDLGAGADRFLDWLADAGCTLWQVLPLVPPGAGFSPYDSPSATALGTHLLSLDRLVADGLLGADALADRPQSPHRVDVDALERWHAPLVRRAARRLAADDPAAVDAFAAAHPGLEEWALFDALRGAFAVEGWQDLPPALARRDPDALERARAENAGAIRASLAAQLLVHRQWARVRAAAHARGVRVVGDVPIFVSGGSADVWAWRHLFRGAEGDDGRWRPDPVTGVPPDYFSPRGQRWGNPHYAWEAHQAEGFAWWRRRIGSVFEHCDLVRVDHFRGFAAAWEVPAGAPDATHGAWAPAPGRALFQALQAELGDLPLIAEDLGIITPDVEALRDELGLPGMKVLQFAFGGTDDHAFLPHTWAHPRWVAYTGTHDTDTAIGWYRSATAREQHRYRVYCGRDGSEPGWDLVRLAWSSVAGMAIAPVQDVLGLDGAWRMNVPGLARGNWTFRAPDLPAGSAARLRELTGAYGRLPPGARADG
jgi:4-alpha-glucanotransferase